jgi:hypothetical protein
MSIAMVQPLPAGTAIRLFLEPPTGAKYWRVLKMGSDSFGGPDDLDYALIAYEGDERVFVDAEYLQNEVMAFYKPFYRMADDTWLPGATAHGTPVALYEDQATDVQSFVRKRLEEGLLEEVKRGNLVAELGYVQVYTAPPALEQNLRFPLVTITLDNESPAERALGEDIGGDDYDMVGGEWFESEGWLAQVQLSIVGWSLNSDERIELRKALRRIIIANLPIFDDQGMVQVQVTFQDVDALNGEYNVNMYQVMGSFSCLAPVRVGRRYGEGEIISDITIRSTNG